MADELKPIQLPRAKPVVITFYDSLINYPYTSKFYVREDVSLEQTQKLVTSIGMLSVCVLAKYKIGYAQFIVPDYSQKLKELQLAIMGTFKWRIVALTQDGRKHTFTIPGYDRELSQRYTKRPNLDHSKWQDFLTHFRTLCTTQEGQPIPENVEVGIIGGNWPPKGAKKRR